MLSEQLETLALMGGKETKQVNKWTITITKATTMLLLELFSDTGEHVHWKYRGQEEEGNDKRKINRTVSGKTSINIKNNQKDKTNDAETTTGSLYGVQRAHGTKTNLPQTCSLNGLISPQGANTTQIPFPFFILLASKGKHIGKKIISKQLSHEEKYIFEVSQSNDTGLESGSVQDLTRGPHSQTTFRNRTDC